MKPLLRKLGLIRQRNRRNHYRFNLKRSCPELAPELAATVLWHRSERHDLAGDTAARFQATPGAHKWHHYFGIYDDLFAGLRNRPINLLEIGVYQGASMHVWRQLFHPDSTLVGVDINPDCSRFDNARDRVHVRIGPQQDGAFLAGVVDEFGPFDLIIDDGSHIASHMIDSFNHLFATGLKAGGLYFVEDTHTNFWSYYRDRPRSFMDFSFGLVECLHAHYAATSSEANFRVGGADSLAAVAVPKIATLIDEIRFLDSVVAIRKASARQLPQSQHW